ncbi:hypothetical protein GF374_00875 [Candidatus Woesearchaeota archaeon]|nr:hypothetical protein [Candidatus Woesearchaeota archaeon]
MMSLITLLKKHSKDLKEDSKLVKYLGNLEHEAKDGKYHLALVSEKLALSRAKELGLDIGIKIEDLVFKARKNYIPKIYKQLDKLIRNLNLSSKFYFNDVRILELQVSKLFRHANSTGQLKKYFKQISKESDKYKDKAIEENKNNIKLSRKYYWISKVYSLVIDVFKDIGINRTYSNNRYKKLKKGIKAFSSDTHKM